MIIDTSALMCILQAEPEARAIAHALAQDGTRQLSAGNFLEAGMLVQARYGDEGSRDLDLLLAKLRIQIVAFTSTQAEIARRAFREFGKGRHPADLNFGDCIAYGLAKDTGEPLLFKGEDFRQTDVKPLIPQSTS